MEVLQLGQEIPDDIIPGLTGASMRDDLCSFYGKLLLSKHKHVHEKDKKMKTKQDCGNEA